MHFVIFAICGGFNLVLAAQCPYREKDLKPWSDVNTWPGARVPGPGEVATVDSSVLLDVTSVTVSQIHIVGNGRLIFKDISWDSRRNITITADGILIKDFGSLIIGSEKCRFQNNVLIRLNGTRTADRTLVDEERGEKFIVVEDQGTLHIYGQDKRGWTRLDETVDRWATAGDNNIVYSHTASKVHFETDIWNQGLAMYIFYECNQQPKFYRVFDFDQNKNTDNEQRAVDQMVEALNDEVEEKEIVAIAKQKGFTTTADLTNLYTKLEAMSGIPSIALRNAHDLDPYALVFQKGGDANESLKPMIGTDVQVARASIVVKEKKVTAVSKIMTKDLRNSGIDFRILSESVGFPTLKVVDDISSWVAGDEIIVTTTDFSPRHTEVRTIKERVDAYTLRLSDELDYRHFGKVEDGVDMRAEVGLLTRNIKIQGVMERGCPDNNENCEEFDYDTYGGHIKMAHDFLSVHIEGVELTNMGQAKDIGHYPTHFHMCLDISGKEAVIKSNSFHNTYLRCVTVHGTWGQNETHPGVQVLDNVAYDVLGHCYFTEDGAEKYTVIDGNLGAYIKEVQTNGFEIDKTGPTVFWITNPKVKLTNNAAAGSEGFGIWYIFPEEPVGPSKGLAYQPGEAKRTPLWLFDNNVVHSVEADGMRFDNFLLDARGKIGGRLDYRPRQDPFDEGSELVKAQFSRLTCYKNVRRNAWFLAAGWFEVMQYSSAESRRGLQSARSKYHLSIKKSIFVGRSRENSEDDGYPDAPDVKHYFGIIYYEVPYYIEKTWFNGFETTDRYIGGALGFQPNKKLSVPFGSNTTDIRFGFVDKADGTGGNRVFDGLSESHVDGTFGINDPTDPTASFRNGDSSMLTCPGEGTVRRHVLMPYSYIATDKCVMRNNWEMMACEYNYGMIRVSAEGRGVNNEMTQGKRMNRLDNDDVAYEDHAERPSSVFTVALGSGRYYYQFQFIEKFPTKATFSGLGIERHDPVVIGLCLPEGVDPSEVLLRGFLPPDVSTRNDGWTAANTLDEVFNDDTMTRYFLDERTVYVRLVSNLERDPHWDQLDNNPCPSNKCPYLSVEVTDKHFQYTPCFTVPLEEQQNQIMTDATMKSMTCDLPASAPDADWGAGDTSREVIQGGWGEWSSWSECCGDQKSIRNRRRVCDNPPPKGGAYCPGDDTETTPCVGCPVDGVLSQWSRWSDCSCDGIAAKSSGRATRTRVCNNVDNGGMFCMGPLADNKPCDGGC